MVSRYFGGMDIPTKFVDKAKFVLNIFTDVEAEYDSLLHLMTLRFDSVWRRRMLSKVKLSSRVRVLDLACGTGLVTFDVARRLGAEGFVVGLDLSPAMLSIARRNKAEKQGECQAELVRAAGEFLPFRGDIFDYITIGLAMRNFANKLAVFNESIRVLVRSGCFLSIDFVRPESTRVWFAYRFHIFHVLPAIGRLVSAYWNRALIYLANSIVIAMPPEETCALLRQVGFRNATFEKISLGIVALIEAGK